MHFLIEHSPVSAFFKNRPLINTLTKREILSHYRGSLLGILWSFITPLLMLVVYTFVFGYVFQARWGEIESSRADFALILFAGLMVFNLFSETITRAPRLILENTNYVKKVVFPLEILPFVVVGSSLFQFMVTFVIWLVVSLIFRGIPPVSIFLLPLVILPFLFLLLGFNWFLASLGVFLRDIGQIINVIVTVAMFLSPLFYSISRLPQELHFFFNLNPVTLIINYTRDVLIFNEGISWAAWGIYSLVAFIIAQLGFLWFVKTKKGFADVI